MTETPLDGLWIAWQRHRRTDSLVERLGVPLRAFVTRKGRVHKYTVLLGRTVVLLLRDRPRLLIVQNPSIVLTMLAAALRPLLRYRLVVDAHNAGVHPPIDGNVALRRVLAALHRRADVTIVTNASLAEVVRANGGRPFVLPDPLPRLTAAPAARGGGDAFTVTFVCTYASDEPYRAVFEAARRLPPHVVVRVTGDPRRLASDERRLAEAAGVRLLGFLPEDEYLATLAGSDAIMDLTTRADCLVCGAYESVALGVPLILSDTPASRGYFDAGAVYAENTPAGIAAAITRAERDLPALRAQVLELRERLESDWQVRHRQLRDLVRELVAP